MGVLGIGAPLSQTIPESILVTKALRVSSNLANLHWGGTEAQREVMAHSGSPEREAEKQSQAPLSVMRSRWAAIAHRPTVSCLEKEVERERWFPAEVLVFRCVKKDHFQNCASHVMSVELGLAQLFQTKPQGPIYRPCD